MHLQHLHIRNPIPYIHSLRLQERVLENHFTYKTLLRNDANLSPHITASPQPTLLTFQTFPTYTVGRRHLTNNPLSPVQVSFLTGASNRSNTQLNAKFDDDEPIQNPEPGELATFFPSPRGGLLTYHAPGQLTAYLILNLRTHGLTPRCYIRLLENAVMRTCARHGVPNVTTTEDPGVWITKKSVDPRDNQAIHANTEACIAGSADAPPNLHPTNRKVCAIGVHVSRGITSHGIGLNVFDHPIETNSVQRALYTLPQKNIYTDQNTPNNANLLEEGGILAPGYLSWGFSRIVACGLEGKSVTWLDRERNPSPTDAASGENEATTVRLEDVAQSLALEVARSLKLEEDAIESLREEDILGE